MATLQTVATRPSGDSHADGKAYFETSTNKMLVWNATAGAWVEIDSDGTGLGFSNNYSLSLDGTVDYATMDTQIPSITGSKTVMGWFRFSNGVSSEGVFATTAGSYGWVFWGATTIFFKAGGGRSFTLDTNLATNTWHHVAFTGDGTDLKCYVNGTKEGATLADGTWSIGEFFRAGTTWYFGGDVDEIALWQGTALSETDIASIANAGAPSGSKAIDLTDYTGLTNWWRMGDSDGGQGTTITDVVGGNDLTTSHTNPFTEETP